MPSPYSYIVPQPSVSGYFDAMRQGRADRQAQEADVRQTALSKYLPQALQGDKDAMAQVMANATPEQQIQFHQMNVQQQAQHVEQIGSILATVKDQPSLDAAKAAYLRLPGTSPEEVQNITLQDIPALLAQSQKAQAILAQKFEQDYKGKMLANDTSRTTAQNAQSYAAAAKDRAAAKNGGVPKPPSGYTWGPNGNLVPIPGGPADLSLKPLTDDQSKALGFANRIKTANEILGGTDATGALTQWGNRSIAAVPGVGNYMAGENYQQADQATRDFINAVLRRESGAAIGQSEFDNAYKQYIPQVGDSQKVLMQKATARKQALQNMLLSSGPANRGAAAEVMTPTTAADVAPAATAAPPAPPQPPRLGEIRNGYQFLGGDPADKTRWRKAGK